MARSCVLKGTCRRLTVRQLPARAGLAALAFRATAGVLAHHAGSIDVASGSQGETELLSVGGDVGVCAINTLAGEVCCVGANDTAKG